MPEYGINRNILECKFLSTKLSVVPALVLIETYWNVNENESLQGERLHESINRNILECKFVCNDINTLIAAVLIETYWNVN